MAENNTVPDTFSRRSFLKQAAEGTAKITAAAVLSQLQPEAPPKQTPDTAPLVEKIPSFPLSKLRN